MPSVTRHPISGEARINVTFRRYYPELVELIPNCDCGLVSGLKPVMKTGDKNRGRYFYSCDNHVCSFFQWYDDEQFLKLRQLKRPKP
jgi:hypothetical protein